MSGRATRAIAAAALAIALGVTAGGCAGQDAIAEPITRNITLGFVNGGNTEFHTCLQRSVEAEAARRGVKVIATNSKQNPKTELANIDDLIRRGVTAIIVQTVSTEALAAPAYCLTE